MTTNETTAEKTENLFNKFLAQFDHHVLEILVALQTRIKMWWHKKNVVFFSELLYNEAEYDCNYFRLCCNLFIRYEMLIVMVKLSEIFFRPQSKIYTISSLLWWFFGLLNVPINFVFMFHAFNADKFNRQQLMFERSGE